MMSSNTRDIHQVILEACNHAVSVLGDKVFEMSCFAPEIIREDLAEAA